MEKASLHCWSQTGTHPLDADFLQTWSRCIDFSCLRRLDLGAGHDARWGVTADALRCMALDRPFARLKTLRIRLARGPDEHHVDDVEFDGRAADFIESLEPLDEAFVSGLVRAGTLAAICRRQGPRSPASDSTRSTGPATTRTRLPASGPTSPAASTTSP
ncbi:hypothetical protein ACKVWH_010364 [Pyricularia oryzae]